MRRASQPDDLGLSRWLRRSCRSPGISTGFRIGLVRTFSAFVSVRDGGRYRARLVRVLSGDANPNGPGVRFKDLSHRFDQSFDGRRQAIHLGSYGVVHEAPVRDAQAACTWTVLVRPGVIGGEPVLLAEESANAKVASADRCAWCDRAHCGYRDRNRRADAGVPLVSCLARCRSWQWAYPDRSAEAGRCAGGARNAEWPS